MSSEPTTEYTEFHRRFLQVEDELDVFSLIIDDIPIWERIRVDVAHTLLQQVGLWGAPHNQESPSVGDYLKGIQLWIRNAFIKNPYLSSDHDVLFWGHSRRKLLDEEWWDIYCDPIHETNEFDYLHVEKPYQNGHFKPAKTESLRYLELIEYTGLLRRKLRLANANLSSNERERLLNIQRRFEEEFGEFGDILPLVRHQLRLQRSTKGLYGRLLDRVSPSVVVMAASSGKEPFVYACQERNIPTIELQHGDISWYSFEYSYPGDREKETFPEYFLTFGDHWSNKPSFPIPNDRVISVGYPYLEMRMKEFEDVPERDQVVFVSNGTSGPMLSRVASELSHRSGLDKDIVYKLHPGEYDRWRETYPYLEDAAVEVIDDTDRSLYELFSESTIQVGGYSAAIYEGLAFGLKTIIFKIPTIEWMAPVINNGDGILVETVDELASELMSDRIQSPSHRYFESNSLNNTREAIRRVIEET